MTNDDEFRYRVVPAGDPHYGAIGLIASNWARLERTLDEAIWEFVQANPPVTACVTAQLIGLGPRFRTLLALHHQLGGDEKNQKKLRRLQNESSTIQQARNRAVHDPWFYNLGTGARARYAATTASDGKPIFDFITVPIAELETLAARITDFDEKAWTMLDTILQPFRDTRPRWFSVTRLDQV